MTAVPNPYAGIDLTITTEVSNAVRQFTGAGKPFARQVDAWWLGLCLGVRKGEKRPRIDGEPRTKFHEGVIFSSDSWRLVHLELIAMADEGERILLDPSKVIAVASSYADFGLEWIVERCIGTSDPVLALLNSLDLNTM